MWLGIHNAEQSEGYGLKVNSYCSCLYHDQFIWMCVHEDMTYINTYKWNMYVKWNASVLGPFLCYEGWIGPGTAFANEIKFFLWNFPQSSIEPATFYSESSTLPLDHGSLLNMYALLSQSVLLYDFEQQKIPWSPSYLFGQFQCNKWAAMDQW